MSLFNKISALAFEKKGLVALLLLLIAFSIQIIQHANNFYVPDSDFFDFRQKAVQISNLEYPENFKRPPLFPVAVAVFSIPFQGKFKELYSAELLVAISALISLLLIYRISFRFLGKHAFWVAWLAAMHPTTMRMAIKPKPEMFVNVLILWAFDRFFQGDRKAYIIALLATLVRYEGALVIAAFFVVDLFCNKTKIKAFVFSLLAGLPLVLWTLLNMENTEGGSYGNYFNSYKLNIQFLDTFWYGMLSFLPYQLYKVWFLSGILLLAGGLIVGAKKYLKETIALALFLLGYFAMHIVWPFSGPDYIVLGSWIVFLFWAVAVSGISPYQSNIKSFFSNKIILVFGVLLFVALLAFSVLYKFPYPQYNINFVTLALFIVPVLFYLFAFSFNKLVRINVFVYTLSASLFISFWMNSKTNADLFDIRYAKADFRMAGEWFQENQQPGDRLAVSQPSVVSIFTDLSLDENFIRVSEIPQGEPGFVNGWLKDKNVSHIAWLSNDKVKDDGNTWTDWKRDNRGLGAIKFLEQGISQPGFEVVHEIKVGPRWGYIYKVF